MPPSLQLLSLVIKVPNIINTIKKHNTIGSHSDNSQNTENIVDELKRYRGIKLVIKEQLVKKRDKNTK